MIDKQDQHWPIPSIEDEAQHWFLKRLAGELSDRDRTDFDAWYRADPRHGLAYDEIENLWDGADALEFAFERVSSSSPGDAPRVANERRRLWKRREERIHKHRNVRFSNARMGLAAGLIAASLALVVFLGTDFFSVLTADYRTGVGEQIVVTLPDGSTAYLNTDSAIELKYSDRQRQISLVRGEALFKVKKDPARPFDVFALGGKSRAVGTAFAVRRQADTAIVTVTEGRVSVAPSEAKPSSATLLHAGDQARYGRHTRPKLVPVADTAAAIAWRQGVISIDGLPLAEAVAEIDRYRPGRIVLIGDMSQLGDVTGRISIASIESGINALASIYGFSVTRITDYLMIVRR